MLVTFVVQPVEVDGMPEEPILLSGSHQSAEIETWRVHSDAHMSGCEEHWLISADGARICTGRDLLKQFLIAQGTSEGTYTLIALARLAARAKAEHFVHSQ